MLTNFECSRNFYRPKPLATVTDRKLVLKEGDNVVLPDYKGQQVTFQGETFDMYREDEILGIVEEDAKKE